MPTLLTNALLCDLDPPSVESASLSLDGGLIVNRADTIQPKPGDEVIDCGGCVVLPGLVNGHTHLYSALATGMPPPAKAPANFQEILKYVWWRLDRALDPASIHTSAKIGALQALRSGTTTLIDHHASPNCIDGSLDLIAGGINSIGLRGVLCYEVTDRNGPAASISGIAENRRYIEKCNQHNDGKFGALVGAHASFTCNNHTMEQLGSLAEKFNTGIHIHVAEDPCDERITHEKHKVSLIKRLIEFGLLRTDSIFAHGIHFNDEAIAHLNDVGTTIAHNTRSNMNNAVGYAPLTKYQCPVQLGTDGIGADMFAEAQAAWFKSRDARAGLSPNDITRFLANSARRASRSLGVTLGQLRPGAVADINITNYKPFTELKNKNLAGHLIFAMNSGCIQDVLVAGEWKLRERKATCIDEEQTAANAREEATKLWKRMESLND